MTKNKTKRSKLKGGDLNNSITSYSNGISSFFTNAWNDTKKNSKGLYSKIMGNKTNNSVSYNSYPKTTTNTNSISTNPYIAPVNNSNSISASTSLTNNKITGGKNSRNRKRKGGSFASVHGLRVARPTYWIKGGKKKSKKNSNKK